MAFGGCERLPSICRNLAQRTRERADAFVLLSLASVSRSPASTTVQNQNKKSKRLPIRNKSKYKELKKERKAVNFKQKPDQFKEALFFSELKKCLEEVNRNP